MKTLIAILIVLFSGSAGADGWSCGYSPYPPYGMRMVCICDQSGHNCHWVSVPK